METACGLQRPAQEERKLHYTMSTVKKEPLSYLYFHSALHDTWGVVLRRARAFKSSYLSASCLRLAEPLGDRACQLKRRRRKCNKKKLGDNNAIHLQPHDETFASQLFLTSAGESWQQNLGGDRQFVVHCHIRQSWKISVEGNLRLNKVQKWETHFTVSVQLRVSVAI